MRFCYDRVIGALGEVVLCDTSFVASVEFVCLHVWFTTDGLGMPYDGF